MRARANIREGEWGDGVAKPAVLFDQVQTQFVWPGTPLRLTIGRQDVSWGTGYWVQEDNRDRFAVGLKLDPVAVLLAYDKFTEVYTEHGVLDDSRAWAVGAITNVAGFRLGLLVAHLRDESRARFPAGDLAYWAGGLFAIGSLGPVRTRAELVYGRGTIDRSGPADLDLRGVGAYASASVPVGPMNLTLEGAYAGGDDATTTDRLEGFFSADYQGPFRSMIFYNNFDISGYAGDAQASSFEADFSVRNARAGKISVGFAPLRNLTLTGAALYASADQARVGGDKALGWEFDVVAVYQVTENVSVSAGLGYAVLGDYWKSAPIAGGTGEKPGNPLVGMVAFATRF